LGELEIIIKFIAAYYFKIQITT